VDEVTVERDRSVVVELGRGGVEERPFGTDGQEMVGIDGAVRPAVSPGLRQSRPPEVGARNAPRGILSARSRYPLPTGLGRSI
jgi:hypothetical protein